MTDFKTLIREGAEASQLMAPGDARDLIARLTAALEEAHEVAVGADHTAAKYWRRMVERDQEAHAAQVRVVDLERDLTVAQAGVKRVQADAWAKGAQWAAVECGVICDEQVAWVTPGDNPYIEKGLG